jgi:hypothetical protein
MTTNKDRIEKLELDFDDLKQLLRDEIQKLNGTSKSQFETPWPPTFHYK